MSYPGNEVQKGIYSRLAGYSALTTALGGTKIYDHVPQNTDAPYVVIGADTTIPWDSKTFDGQEFTLTIHVWDKSVNGRKSVKTYMGHIYAALHNQESSVTVVGQTVLFIRCEYTETFQETVAEGESNPYYHGVMRFRMLVETT